MEQQQIIENHRRCKKCTSLQTYLKLSTGERVCRACGYVEKLDAPEKEVPTERADREAQKEDSIV